MKTAMQELIERLKRNIEEMPNEKNQFTQGYKAGLSFVIELAEYSIIKEKEQIIEARLDGITCAAAFQEMPSKYTTGEQYYNQTYKQTNGIVVDAIKSQVTTTGVWTPKTN